MIIEYLEFDIDENGKGVMYILCTDSVFWHYISCEVFNNRGLKFDLNTCNLIGICNSEGVEPPDVIAKLIPARHYVEECLAVEGTKTQLKNEYWKVFKGGNSWVLLN